MEGAYLADAVHLSTKWKLVGYLAVEEEVQGLIHGGMLQLVNNMIPPGRRVRLGPALLHVKGRLQTKVHDKIEY